MDPVHLQPQSVRLHAALAGVTASELRAAADEWVTGPYEGQPGFRAHAILHHGRGDDVAMLQPDDAARAESACHRWYSRSEPGGCAEACRHDFSRRDPESMQRRFWSRPQAGRG